VYFVSAIIIIIFVISPVSVSHQWSARRRSEPTCFFIIIIKKKKCICEPLSRRYRSVTTYYFVRRCFYYFIFILDLIAVACHIIIRVVFAVVCCWFPHIKTNVHYNNSHKKSSFCSLSVFRSIFFLVPHSSHILRIFTIVAYCRLFLRKTVSTVVSCL